MARSFNDSNQYIEFADNGLLSLPNGDWSMACWLYFPDLTGFAFQTVYSHGSATASHQLNMYVEEFTGAMYLHVGRGGTSGYWFVYYTGAVTTGVWAHWIFTRESGNIAIYKNATQLITESVSTPFVDCNPTTVMRLANYSTGGDYLGGNMCEVARWNRALIAGEKTALAQGFSPALFPKDLIFYLPMINEDTLKDRIGNLAPTYYNSPGVAHHPPIRYRSP